MENTISYLNKNFTDYQEAIKEHIKVNYPELANDFDDASIGSLFVDLFADIADNLTYHIDRTFNETNIASAQEKTSLLNLARSNGLKIPGRKSAMVELEFSCQLPLSKIEVNQPDWDYAPIIKKGTKISSGDQIFEIMGDMDFATQFDENGNSNRTFETKRNSNGSINSYLVKKRCVAVAGDSKIYRKVLNSNDITPFMEIVIPDTTPLSIESIITLDGTDLRNDPLMNEFMINSEEGDSCSYKGKKINRFFEVDNLLEQTIWADKLDSKNVPISENVNGLYAVTRGEWKPLKQKFVTEFTDNGFLKVTFGSGGDKNEIPETSSNFAKNQISRIINNEYMGVLPKANQTMFILYRSGGGKASNVPSGSLNKMKTLIMEIGKGAATDKGVVAEVKKSITVTNPTPSVSGKDAPTVDEIRYMIKYNNASQNRCVTLKDYYYKLLQLPPKYGTPFRVGVTEENNKIMMYLLGLDYNGHLSNTLLNILVNNIVDYLYKYKLLGDFVEIKSGDIINLSIEADIYLDKNYNTGDVVLWVINKIKEYMDINTHQMGEDIYIGDLKKEISKIDGVLNLIDLRIYNEFGNGYSQTQTQQPKMAIPNCATEIDDDNEYWGKDRFLLDMRAADDILYSNSHSMFEVKYPEKDIKIKPKIR